MVPTFRSEGDFVLVESLSLHFPSLRPLARGDIVTFVSPLDARVSVCKRVIGLEGDRVLVDPQASDSEWTNVPRGHIWVLGDNLESSRDSRLYGPVSKALLRGRVLAQVCGSYPHAGWSSVLIAISYSSILAFGYFLPIRSLQVQLC